MMKIAFLLALALLLGGCATTARWQAAANQSALQETAQRLAEMVKTGRLTKTQAADRLNRERLALAGPQPMDDAVFAFYRQLAVQRDRGAITNAQARFQMQRELLAVRKRYRQRNAPPAQPPIFTNFMMSLYGLPPL